MKMHKTIKFLAMPIRFKRFYRTYRDQEFNLLDVGCGENGPLKIKEYFKYCHYYGMDKIPINKDELSFKLMDEYFKIDLDKETLDKIPNNFFDGIILSHVIEHLHNGVNVVSELTAKLKVGGLFYIEYPRIQSFSSPRLGRACLHFCDDPTHVKVYTMHEIINVLLNKNFEILKAGTRRDAIRIIFAPVFIIMGILKGTRWFRGLWDLFGCAEYIFAKK